MFSNQFGEKIDFEDSVFFIFNSQLNKILLENSSMKNSFI